MDNEKTINNGKILYLSGFGDDSNETVTYALSMPILVTTYIDDDGSGIIEFGEKMEKDNWRLVCQTGFIPDVVPPAPVKQLKQKYDLEDNISKNISGWISVFMREGIFYTDAKKGTSVNFLDLRDIAARVEKEVAEVYSQYQDEDK